MTQQDQIKVINAGFTILRPADQPTIRIKFKNREQFEWKTLESYPNKHKRNKALAEYLLRPDIIQD